MSDVSRGSQIIAEAARTAWSALRLLPADACRDAIAVLIHEFERVHGRAFAPPDLPRGRSR